MTRYVRTDVSSVSSVNSELALVKTAIDSMLDRNGVTPNSMEADLDLNSNDILNVDTLNVTTLTLNGVTATTSLGTYDLTANYTWTGTHNFTSGTITGVRISNLVEVVADTPATKDILYYNGSNWVLQGITASIDLAASYSWTGTHTFSTRPTFNSNIVYDAGNINTAVVLINTQTGTTYTTVIGDAGTMVTLSNASAIACTIPPNSSVAYPIGTVISFNQLGAGQVTLTAGGGVTLRAEVGLKTTAQYSSASALKIASDIWIVTGSLSA